MIYNFSFFCLCGVALSEPVETVQSGVVNVCAANPCKNSCECQSSCRDENSYYCKSGNSPFVGKNCDYEMDLKCNSGHLYISVGAGFMTEMEQSVQNGFLQFCDSPVYICDPNPECMFEKIGNNYVFDSISKPNCPSVKITSSPNGDYFTSGTIVWDRITNSAVRMPRPLKSVTCSIDVLPVSFAISPHPGTGNKISDPGAPDVNMSFWKTEYGVWPGIMATRGLIQDEVKYIISETIHVRITPSDFDLPHIVDRVKPDEYTQEGIKFVLKECSFSKGPNSSDKTKYVFIRDNQVAANPIVPVRIEHAPATYHPYYDESDRLHNMHEALAFNFQVAVFKNGDPMEINCVTRIEYGTHFWYGLERLEGRKRRDLLPEEQFVSASEPFVTNTFGNKSQFVSENGIQGNLNLISSPNDIWEIRTLKDEEEFLNPVLSDRTFTIIIGFAFVVLSVSLIYVSSFYWFKLAPRKQYQLNSVFPPSFIPPEYNEYYVQELDTQKLNKNKF